MKKQLTGNDTNLISRVLYEIKIREFIKELRQDIDSFDPNSDLVMGMIMVDLGLFIAERLHLAEESVNLLLMSALELEKKDIENITHNQKMETIIAVFKEASKSVMIALEAMGLNIKKNMNQLTKKN